MMYLPETIEHAGQRILTTAQLAEAYGTDKKEISKNFNNNRERYEEGLHYFVATGEALEAIRKICDLPKNVGKLYLWTARGALLHAKSLNTDKAWEVYGFLIENYFNPVKKQELPTMSVMEMIAHIANNAVETEQRMKAIETAQAEQKKKLETIRSAYEINARTWRTEAKNIVNQIVKATGKPHARVWIESYEMLNAKAHCNIRERFERRKARMFENGAKQSLINALSTLDIIEDDPKLTEIYIGILRDMIFKAGI